MVHSVAATRLRDDRAAAPVQQWFRGLRLGPASRLDALEVFPVIVAEGVPPVSWLLAPEAIVRNALSVAEMPNGAVVGKLHAANRGDVAVLILEGETLVGCKQNRVVTRTVLVPPKSTVVLEVGCVEHGRWNHVSRHFAPGGLRMEGRIRSRTVVERSRGGFDQRRLWSQVADRLEGSGVVSGTSDVFGTN